MYPLWSPQERLNRTQRIQHFAEQERVLKKLTVSGIKSVSVFKHHFMREVSTTAGVEARETLASQGAFVLSTRKTRSLVTSTH